MRKLILSLSVILSTCVSAESSNFEAGLGVVSINNVYRGLPTETLAFPLISYQNGEFAIEGAELSYNLCDCLGFNIKSHLKPGFDFLDASKSNDSQIKNLSDREISVLGGFTLTKEHTKVIFAISLSRDISGNSNGAVIEGNLSKPLSLSEQIIFIPSFAVAAMNEQYSSYYFGVEAAQDALPKYSIGSTYRMTASSTVVYKQSADLSLLTSISMSKLSSEIAASPLVEDTYSQAVVVGFKYAFN